MLDDFRILIAAGKPARVLVQEVKEITPLLQEQFHFPLYTQYQSSKWSLRGVDPRVDLKSKSKRTPKYSMKTPS